MGQQLGCHKLNVQGALQAMKGRHAACGSCAKEPGCRASGQLREVADGEIADWKVTNTAEWLAMAELLSQARKARKATFFYQCSGSTIKQPCKQKVSNSLLDPQHQVCRRFLCSPACLLT
jgi:hypothetical protein